MLPHWCRILTRAVIPLAMWTLACSADDASGPASSAESATESPSDRPAGEASTDTEPVEPAFDIAWAQVFAGTRQDEIDGVAVAEDGATFITGKFEDRATLGGEDLVSAGRADIPLARFGPDGEVSWVRSFGGPGEDNLFDIAATPGGGAVAAGIFSEAVEFGDVTLTSSGATDCVVVSVADDGETRWARSFGGPGVDGCNEVGIVPGGGIVTSIDTYGGWTPLDADPIPLSRTRSTVLLRLDEFGEPEWMRVVGGPGSQRGKALGVGADGSVVFGGDTRGPLEVEGTEFPAPGGGRDAWLSRWSPEGDLEWAQVWGGPGNDLAKGVVDDGDTIYVVGPFTGSIEIGGAALTSTGGEDLAVAALDLDGRARWVASITSPADVGGAEVVSAPGGGIVFGGQRPPGTRFGGPPGARVEVEPIADGAAWLAVYRPNGDAVVHAVDGAVVGRVGEIDRVGDRVVLDVTLWGSANTVDGSAVEVTGRKDSSVWAGDLAG